MIWYRLAGQEIDFSCPVSDLEPYEVTGMEDVVAFPLPGSSSVNLTSRTTGWVGGGQREVEVWSASSGVLLKVAGGGDFYIAPRGRGIVRVDVSKADWLTEQQEVFGLDREILVGPALVLALAQRGIWSLHASAARVEDCLTAFLGESGQGKSTIAGYLDQAGGPKWSRIADDILPAALLQSGVSVWPHFPQLKLPNESQPGPRLPEVLPLNRICVLTSAEPDQIPDLKLLSPRQALQAILSHTAGTRMFDPALLASHFDFCAGVAGRVPIYGLVYPHRRDALPEVKELLESAC